VKIKKLFSSLVAARCYSNVASVANPDRHDTHFEQDNQPQWEAVSRGESHMARIQDETNYWERCLQIP